MRGLVDEVRVRREVTGNGATAVTATVTGRSFQKVWETTPCWFNQLGASNYLSGLLLQASGSGIVNSTPTRNVRTILFRLFDIIANTGRANWLMPAEMPGRTGTMSETVLYDDAYFDDVTLARATPTGNLFFPDVSLWPIAMQHFADAQFCELFTDVLPRGGLRALAADPDMAGGLDPADSRMVLAFRDKPFPTVDPQARGGLGLAGPYFRLPTWTLAPQDLRSTDVGTSDYEAFNAFMTVGAYGAEDAAGFGTLKSPLWRVDDMRRRGMRRLDATSPYRAIAAKGVSDLELFQARRARLRDWHCQNGELRQGSLQMWRAWPQVRVGGRVRVRAGAPEEDFTGYVESVRHQWSPQSGVSTAVDFTRGWTGSDRQLVDRLRRISGSYSITPSQPA